MNGVPSYDHVSDGITYIPGIAEAIDTFGIIYYGANGDWKAAKWSAVSLIAPARFKVKGTVKHGPKYSTKTYNQWYQGTFKNKTESIDYHLRKHGKGRTPEQYTQAAMSFFSKNKHLAQEVTLSTGKKGYKIQTGTGRNKVGGYWTKDGKLVTFWD